MPKGPRNFVVMDAKALFDKDDRAALEVAIIKESLLAVGGRPR